MDYNRPYAILREDYIIKTSESTFTVDFFNLNTREHFVVIDSYPCKAPVHPQRHIGWFRFDDINNGESKFSVSWDKQEINVKSLSGKNVIDKWVNTEVETQDLYPISLRIVIRKKFNNEIVFEDKLIMYSSVIDYEADKSYFFTKKNHVNVVAPHQQIIDKKLKVCIVLRNFFDKDAIGYFVWDSWVLLSLLGIQTEIFVQNCEDRFRPFVRNAKELLQEDKSSLKNTLVFYNYSIKDEDIEYIKSVPCCKIAHYLGITEPSQLRIFDAELAEECKYGLENLDNLLDFDLIIANSESSRREFLYNVIKKKNTELSESNIAKQIYLRKSIKQKVYKKSRILPPIISMQATWENVNEDLEFKEKIEKLGDIILYVGRLYPNKRVADVIDIFREYLKTNPNATLALVGGSHTSYKKYLQHKIEKYGQGERFVFFQQLTKEQLKSMYQVAKVFITMSEHEGFCVPLVEAMNFEIPIIARASTAMPEVLGNSAKLVCNKDCVSISAEIHRLIVDEDYRRNIIEKQNKQFENYTDMKLASEFLNTILGCYNQYENNH